MERILIYHPDIARTTDYPADVTVRAFEIVWKDKGWRRWPPRKSNPQQKEK